MCIIYIFEKTFTYFVNKVYNEYRFPKPRNIFGGNDFYKVGSLFVFNRRRIDKRVLKVIL